MGVFCLMGWWWGLSGGCFEVKSAFSLRSGLGRFGDGLFEFQFCGFGCDLAHLCDEALQLSVVGDPLLVELGLGGAEASGDGLAVDFGRPLEVRAVGLGRISVAFAAWGAAARVAADDASRADEPDVGQLGGDLAVAAFVFG